MAGSNTRLTVSYGSFSCTLEGFDDPINTMEAVAGFFRDLSAKSPGFAGACPPPGQDHVAPIGTRVADGREWVSLGDGGRRPDRPPAHEPPGMANCPAAAPDPDHGAADGRDGSGDGPQAAPATAPTGAPADRDTPFTPSDMPVPRCEEHAAVVSPGSAGTAKDTAAGCADPAFKEGIGADEAAFCRLIAATNARLDEAEANRRRSAVAHLKAAVVATREDGGLRARRDDEDAAAIGRYRDDLAMAIRPASPGQGDTPPHTAPLVLAAGLRVDRADGGRPEGPDADDMPSFEDFARRMDAASLPDMIEAATAYAMAVEDTPSVTRPQILQWLPHRHRGEGSAREDILRSFGQLLHSGRLRRDGTDRFALGIGGVAVPGARR